MDKKLVQSVVEEVVKNYIESGQTRVNKIPVAVSNRHIHLSSEDSGILFGPGYSFEKMKDLSQPGQFACKDCVTLVGPSGVRRGVRILGPIRNKTQVEISRTDSFELGLKPPVRDSGDLAGSPGIIIAGPKGAVTLKEGVICAWRHIHMTPHEAGKFGVVDKQHVKVKVGGERGLVFENVLVRVSSAFALEMHVDTDEANAAFINNGDLLELII